MSLENSRSCSLEESLSALLDNEADDLEIRRLLKNSPQNKELGQTWRRFNLVSSVLHHEEVAPFTAAASQRIFDAIEAEESYSSSAPAPVITSVGTLLKGFGRMAIAASVALAAFISFQTFIAEPGVTAPVAVQSAPSTDAMQLANTNSNTVEFDAAAQQRLNEYIDSASIQYNEYNSARSQFNIFEDSQLIRQVNQIEP
jgi:negative regulator of sigma E activity